MPAKVHHLEGIVEGMNGTCRYLKDLFTHSYSREQYKKEGTGDNGASSCSAWLKSNPHSSSVNEAIIWSARGKVSAKKRDILSDDSRPFTQKLYKDLAITLNAKRQVKNGDQVLFQESLLKCLLVYSSFLASFFLHRTLNESSWVFLKRNNFVSNDMTQRHLSEKGLAKNALHERRRFLFWENYAP